MFSPNNFGSIFRTILKIKTNLDEGQCFMATSGGIIYLCIMIHVLKCRVESNELDLIGINLFLFHISAIP